MEDRATGGALIQRAVAVRRFRTFRGWRTLLLRRPSRRELLSWLMAGVMLLTVAAAFAATKSARVQRGACWGLVVLYGMAGWGWVVERLALPTRAADLGLRLAWGAGALIAVGGVLCLFSLATKPVLLTLVLGGTFLTLADLMRRGFAPRVRPAHRARAAEASAAAGRPGRDHRAGGAVGPGGDRTILGGASGADLNQNDDHVAYLIFPKKILATGTLIDPFSLRRITGVRRSFVSSGADAGPARAARCRSRCSISAWRCRSWWRWSSVR